MKKDLLWKLWETQEQMRYDPEYQALFSQWEDRNARFLNMLNSLEREQQEEFFDYLSYMLELHYKTIEYLMK